MLPALPQPFCIIVTDRQAQYFFDPFLFCDPKFLQFVLKKLYGHWLKYAIISNLARACENYVFLFTFQRPIKFPFTVLRLSLREFLSSTSKLDTLRAIFAKVSRAREKFFR